MKDSARGHGTAKADKYSDEQVEYSRRLLGREPEGADLQAHHDAPAHGTVYADDSEGDGDV